MSHTRRRRGELRAQAAYDMEIARRKLAPELKKIRPWNAAAAL
ncbi:hypothetical protein [Collinsella bouchesdurhonensis]|nr:hypothetical protein [Collinsella bouchesdurhonensis]